LEPQHEDNEDSDFNLYVADHQDDESQNEEDGEEGGIHSLAIVVVVASFIIRRIRLGITDVVIRHLDVCCPLSHLGYRDRFGLAHPHLQAQAQAQSYKDSPQQFYFQHSDLD
jgi:hypothetical protein